jgi:hypothetical protein
MNIPVVLVDQFGQTTHEVMAPRYFCNPVVKRLDTGEVFPIVDPEAHLACYWIQPPQPPFAQLNATDQFGVWALRAREAQWLCLPSTKLQSVGVQKDTWGRVKKLYKE